VPLAVSLILMGVAGIVATAFVAADILGAEMAVTALTDYLKFNFRLAEYVLLYPVLLLLTVIVGGAYILACTSVMKWSLCLIRHAVNPGRYVITFNKEAEQEQRKKKRRRTRSIPRRVKKVLGTIRVYVGFGVFVALFAAFVLFVLWYLGWRFVLSGEFFDAIALLRIVRRTELLDVWWDVLEIAVTTPGVAIAPIIVLAYFIKDSLPVFGKSTNRGCSE